MLSPPRRQFFKKAFFALVGAIGFFRRSDAALPPATGKLGMIIDLNRCRGCQSCVIACKAENDTTPGQFSTRVTSSETSDGRVFFTPTLCNQCDDAPCIKACPPGATFRLPNGIVMTDWNKCPGEKCSYYATCVNSCPYGSRFPDPRHGKRFDKCDFCYDRLEKGLLPACVETCGSHARLFGDYNNPKGEFGEYFKTKHLVNPKPELGIRTRVLYVPSTKNKKGIVW